MNELEKLVEVACKEKAILDLLTEANTETRNRLANALGQGDRKASQSGTATLTNPKKVWRVVDPAAFLEWVQANCPEHIITTVSVSPAFRAWVEKSGGFDDGKEVHPVAGLGEVTGSPSLQVRVSDEARVWAVELLASDVLEIGS